MRHTPITVQFRRQRLGKTNYGRRIAQLKSKLQRLFVKVSLNNIDIQIIEYQPDGDKVIMSASSRELLKMGWKGHRGNTSAAYLTGLILAKKAKGKITQSIILSSGKPSLTAQCATYAAAAGAIDGGLKLIIDKEVLPSTDRIHGKHIADLAKKMHGKPEYDKQFGGYKKRGLDPQKLPEHVQELIKKIKG